MIWWQQWIVGQVDASLAAGLLLLIAFAGRRRLSPESRSVLALMSLARLAMPPLVISPWTDAIAELPPLDDARLIVADLLDEPFASAVPVVAGLVAVLGLAGTIWRARMAARRWRETTDPAPACLQQRVDALAQRAGLARAPVLRLSRLGEGPLAAGVRAPVIVIPASAVHGLDDQAMNAALAHEVAHHRHSDMLWLATVSGLSAMAWFNPLAYLGVRLHAGAREDAADDWAIAHTSHDAPAYCEALLRSARLSAPSPAFSAGAHPVKRRLRRLFDRRARRSSPLSPLALIALALLGAACLPGARGEGSRNGDDVVRTIVRESAIRAATPIVRVRP